MMDVLLVIDGGGSRTRSLVITKGGAIVGAGAGGPSNHLQVGREVVVQSLRDATREALAQAAVDRRDVRSVSAGLAGVDYDGVGASEMETVFRELGFAQALINGDMVIAHAGALMGRPGVLALAGTGSAILGVGPGRERVKVGGWGPIYGNEGSAQWIGRQTLIAAARAYDGRGPETALLGAVLRALGLGDFRETVERVYLKGMQPHEIAALSRIAYETAEAGDVVARALFSRAGEELAEGVEAAFGLLGMKEEERLCSYQGAVLESCALMRESFTDHLKRRFPEASVRPPRFEPVIGAYLLGRESVGWPLDSEALEALETERPAK